jgi:hypothetical protein
MKRITSGIILLVALLFALPLAYAGAQDTETLEPGLDQDGLVYAVSRSWSIDFATLAAATPQATPTTPDLFMVLAMVMRYDSPQHAEDAFDSIKDESSDQVGSDAPAETMETFDLDGIGDQAMAAETTAVEAEGTWISRLATSQQGELLYIVMVIGGNAERVANADVLLDAMVNDAQPGEGEGTYSEDGASTGGLWDVLPAMDHPALTGLINFGDQIVFPEPDNASS